MAVSDIDLMAHLMRRAGFGSPRSELESRATKGYTATVDELVYPEDNGIPPIDESIIFRHNPGFEIPGGLPHNGQAHWMYRLINTPRPLEEKMALFWHNIFATAHSKLDNCNQMQAQVDMFRRHGMGNYRELLVRLAKDPAMIFWLDNNENHKGAPNENWGRELLELFSMGQGNYTELDVKECSRAFTGWTIAPKLPRMPYLRHLWQFEYLPHDHDDGEKVFLGQRGRFNGEDIIDIIVRQPATARFMARHLYNFFVADEVQVPSWLDEAPRDPAAVNRIAATFVDSGYDIRATLHMIFNADFFKDPSVWHTKVKSPAEVIAGTMRLVQDHTFPKPGIGPIGMETAYQGQSLLDPPSVEGWHTGQEWLDTGALVRRINFVADRVGVVSLPGINDIIQRLAAKENLTVEEFVDGCADLMGPVQIDDDTRQELIVHAQVGGPVRRGRCEEERLAFSRRVGEMLRLIASAPEFQLA